MKYQTIQRCREEYPVQLMCRCLKVSTSGFDAWCKRPMSPTKTDNQRLLPKIRDRHAAVEGFIDKLKGERINRPRYLKLADAHWVVFVHIERFHNPWMQRKLYAQYRKLKELTHLSLKRGRTHS